MNRMQAILHMHYKDWFWWLVAPWAWILLPSFAVNLIISIIANTDGGIYTGGLASIYIYMAVLGGLVVYRTFPFALGFTMRRTDYFLGTTVAALAAFFISAIELLLLSFIESITNGWGVRLHFFHLPYLSDGPFYAQFWISFIAMAFLYVLGFTIGSVYQRFGRNGLFGLTGAVLLLGTIGSYACTRFNWWGDIFVWMAHQSAVGLVSWLLLPFIVFLPISYLLLRKATVA